MASPEPSPSRILKKSPSTTSDNDHKAIGAAKETLTSIPRKRNAFSEMMAPKPKHLKKDTPDSSSASKAASAKPQSNFQTGLLRYITEPASFPAGTIVRQTEHTILIRDLYPKALVHLLLMPRDPAFYNLTPFEAFNPQDETHTAFLELMREEAASAAKLAASELSRLVSPYSESSKARNEALEAEDPPSELPPGRDFLPDIKIGVHARPSMSTLHIHIISVDLYSKCLKHRKHYQSFASPFFVSLDDLPLMEEDNLMDPVEQEHVLKGDMGCWRCGGNFGNKFKQLKDHLEEEYLEWRKT